MGVVAIGALELETYIAAWETAWAVLAHSSLDETMSDAGACDKESECVGIEIARGSHTRRGKDAGGSGRLSSTEA
jgi:hypothetical protein